MTKLNLPHSLSRLITFIKEAVEEEGKLSPLRAKELVLKAEIRTEDLMYYADFDHPLEDCYGRKLVHDGGNFEIMVMSWMPGDYSSIHNHGYTEWGVVQVFGPTHHMIYQLKDNTLSFAKRELLPPGTAIKVNNALIHQMGNATTAPYLTLHVYGCNHRDSGVTADSKGFELEKDRTIYTSGGAFFNLPEADIDQVTEGVKASDPVFLHYAHLLMNYYHRQEQTSEIHDLKEDLLQQMQKRMLANNAIPME